MIHYTQIIWEEVAFIWKVTGKAVAIFMTGTVSILTVELHLYHALFCLYCLYAYTSIIHFAYTNTCLYHEYRRLY